MIIAHTGSSILTIIMTALYVPVVGTNIAFKIFYLPPKISPKISFEF